ncbi:hypothetical protein M0R45_009112 [Rubus argutus]|uniref:Uncharacterized protein n=1 Tax=Rubus argutus TaxID=59490 RepID=A0AAW1Y407_RUBAR
MAEATQIEGGAGWLGLAAALRSRDGHTVTGLGSPSRGNDGDEDWSGLTAWAHGGSVDDVWGRDQLVPTVMKARVCRGRGLMGLCSAVVSCYGAIAGGAARVGLGGAWKRRPDAMMGAAATRSGFSAASTEEMQARLVGAVVMRVLGWRSPTVVTPPGIEDGDEVVRRREAEEIAAGLREKLAAKMAVWALDCSGSGTGSIGCEARAESTTTRLEEAAVLE